MLLTGFELGCVGLLFCWDWMEDITLYIIMGIIGAYAFCLFSDRVFFWDMAP
jgi:hypothetical protein